MLEKIEIISFNIGEQLIDEEIIPGRVLIISEGYARNLFRDNGKLKNFKKCEFGEIIGASSIMSGQPCENFSAGQGLIAFSLDFLIKSNASGNEVSNSIFEVFTFTTLLLE